MSSSRGGRRGPRLELFPSDDSAPRQEEAHTLSEPFLAVGPPPEDDGRFTQEPVEEYKVYWQRWWILILACLISGSQGGFWNNWGPIAPAVKPLFGWSDGDVALAANWGPLCYFVAVLPSSWLLDRAGLRPACLAGSALTLAGALVRCITVEEPAGPALMQLGQLLNGLGGPVAMAVGPLVAAHWFPVHQRTTATAVISVTNYGGCALMFVLGPLLVPLPASDTTAYSPHERHEIGQKLLRYMGYDAGLAALVFLGVAAYCPSNPPSPPSRTASSKRMDFRAGLRDLWRNRDFWAIAVSYGVLTGFYAAWGSMLAPNMEGIFPKKEATELGGWLGCWAALAGCGSGVLFGMWSDRFKPIMKPMVMAVCLAGSVCFLVFSLVCVEAFPALDRTSLLVLLYLTSVGGGFLINGTIPLFYEMGVELAYPVAEGVTMGVLTVMNNVGCLVFLVVPMVPGLGTRWMNWAVCAAALVPVLLMCTIKEHYKRTADDLDPRARSNLPPHTPLKPEG